jgi:hypothetical protein
VNTECKSKRAGALKNNLVEEIDVEEVSRRMYLIEILKLFFVYIFINQNNITTHRMLRYRHDKFRQGIISSQSKPELKELPQEGL